MHVHIPTVQSNVLSEGHTEKSKHNLLTGPILLRIFFTVRKAIKLDVGVRPQSTQVLTRQPGQRTSPHMAATTAHTTLNPCQTATII